MRSVADRWLTAGAHYRMPDGTVARAWRADGPYWGLDAGGIVRYTVGPDGGILCQDRPTGWVVEQLRPVAVAG